MIPQLTVVYSHGRNGSPWYGQKILELRPVALSCGYNILSIRYSEEEDVESMEQKLISLCLDEVAVPGDLVLLGSSRGAYVTVKASKTIQEKYNEEGQRTEGDKLLPPRKLLGSFLIAPAFYIKPDYYPDQDPTPPNVKLTIIHGMDDQIIDYRNSILFTQKHRAELHLLHGGHRLNTQKEIISDLFNKFLEQCAKFSEVDLKKWLTTLPIRDEEPD